MNKLILLLLTFSLLKVVSSQEYSDNRILEYLGEQIVAKIQNERPQHFAYYEYILEDSYQLFEIENVEENSIEYETIQTVICTNYDKSVKEYTTDEVVIMLKNKNFNVLTSNLRRNKDTVKYYYLSGTNLVIALEAESAISRNYKKS